MITSFVNIMTIIPYIYNHCRIMINEDNLPPFIYLLFLVFTTQNFMRSVRAKNPVNKKAKRRFMSLYNFVKCELNQRLGSTRTFARTFDILRNYLKHNDRMFGCWNDDKKVYYYEVIPWTDEEIQVWKLILFYASQMVDFIPKVDDEELLSKLKSEVESLRRKEYRETAATKSTKWKKNKQTVICQICEFHGDPKDPSKTCKCCSECRSTDADCKRCRICGQHDSTKCTCCKICNTRAEYCQKCQECNEHECSCEFEP